ncbi:ribbon-helix-helix domain-containing protein [Geoglobus ahangari]
MSRAKVGDGTYLNVRVAKADVDALNELVEKKVFMNVSDAVRTAIRELISKYRALEQEKEVECDV